MIAKDKPNELRLTRVYDAPVKAVWDAWTDNEQVAKWWGPRGFSITTHSKDLRPGGHWAYTMHGPDGVNYENKTLYHEVEKHARLVYDHGGNDDRPPLFRVTVQFTALKGKTKMEMTMALATPEAAAQTAKFIKQVGGNSTWDRLAEYLKGQKGGHCFVINRSLPFPVAKVFEMWSQPEHFAKWLPPAGFTMDIRRAEIREGGNGFFRMSNDAGFSLYCRFDYEVVESPRRIVYVQQFCDEQENPGRHPGLPTFPATLRTTVTFVEEEEDTTRLTVTSEPVGKITSEELAAFQGERPGMTLGWTGSFDKLEEVMSQGS